jgi:hypothetical protein
MAAAAAVIPENEGWDPGSGTICPILNELSYTLWERVPRVFGRDSDEGLLADELASVALKRPSITFHDIWKKTYEGTFLAPKGQDYFTVQDLLDVMEVWMEQVPTPVGGLRAWMIWGFLRGLE